MADLTAAHRVVARRAHEDPLWVQWTLILTAVFIMTALVVVPLVNVFVEAFARRTESR